MVARTPYCLNCGSHEFKMLRNGTIYCARNGCGLIVRRILSFYADPDSRKHILQAHHFPLVDVAPADQPDGFAL